MYKRQAEGFPRVVSSFPWNWLHHEPISSSSSSSSSSSNSSSSSSSGVVVVEMSVVAVVVISGCDVDVYVLVEIVVKRTTTASRGNNFGDRAWLAQAQCQQPRMALIKDNGSTIISSCSRS